MTDLTTVELLWLDGAHENACFRRAVAEQIIDRRRRIPSFAPGTGFGAFYGRPTISAQSCRASTFPRAATPDSARSTCLGSHPVVTFLPAHRLGRKSSVCCT